MKYEYKTLQIKNIQKMIRVEIDTKNLDQTLKLYTNDGWQVDQAFPLPGSYGYSYYTIIILKRRIKEQV